MNVVYNSSNYSVLEYPNLWGLELIDKHTGRSGFLQGAVAAKFRADMQQVLATSPSVESVDAFLDEFDVAWEQRLTYH